MLNHVGAVLHDCTAVEAEFDDGNLSQARFAKRRDPGGVRFGLHAAEWGA